MIPEWVWNLIGGSLGAIALLLLKRALGRMDTVESRVQAMELSMARDIPNKEDFAQLSSRLDRLDGTLSQVRDMVIRLEERGNVHRE